MMRVEGGSSIPKISNETRISLEGEALARVRYQELARDLISNKNTKKAEVLFQWKPVMEEDFNENEHSMKAKMELHSDGVLELTASDWQATISPDGMIHGNMPEKLVDFLTYDKRERDVTMGGRTQHEIDYIKQGFGKGGHSISINFIDERK